LLQDVQHQAEGGLFADSGQLGNFLNGSLYQFRGILHSVKILWFARQYAAKNQFRQAINTNDLCVLSPMRYFFTTRELLFFT
jgi:hypothetical protein